MVGQTLGHFRITARLGSGGMGVVYRAHDQTLDRTVAIKVVGRDSGATPVDRARIVEEARASSGLSHPNICTVYETGEIDGQAYIAMEYVEGRPLSELIPANGLPSEAVVRYGAQIADALAHAHARGVVHRDLKTPNVVISADGRAKVLDFGLARRVPSSVHEAVTRSSDAVRMGGLAGTLPYMPPELLLGQSTDERGDIWSLGVTLFEMAMGDLPFKGRNEFELTATILRSPPQPLPAHVPPMIRSVIQRCLSKEPAHRYQRAGEARAALEAIQSDTAIAAEPPPPAVSSTRGWWIGGAAAAVLVAALIGLWFQRDRQEQRGSSPGGGRLVPAVSSDTPVFDPALSMDGKMLCYGAEDAGGQPDLFVRRVAGGALIKLTNDPARETAPRFSPDGERIVFTRRESAEGAPELRIVPALGGDTIASIPGGAGAVWSGDGRELAFLRRAESGQLQLTVTAVDGSNARVVLESDSAYPFLREPAWATDGELAIVRGTGGIAGEIWLVPANGGTPRRPFTDPPEVFADSPVFTRDGLALIHSSNRGGATNIWSYPMRGGPPVRLTTGPGPDIGPTVAADGTIAFLNSRWRNALEIHGLGNDPPRTLTTHSPYLWGPVFSPDASEVAFSRSEMDGSWHIWTIPAAGGAPRRITSSAAGEVYPRYSPDGQFIWFHTWETPRRIGRVRREGGAIELVSFGAAGGDGFPDLSPDGQQLVMTRTDPDAERIYVAPSAGGVARRLTAVAGAVAKWSPDGKRIVFAANRGYTGGILVVDVSTGREQRLTTTGGWPVWLPDGSEVAYLVLGRNGNQEIRVVPAKGGPSRPLGQVRYSGWNYPFAISPDGKAIVTSNSRHISDEIWLLESAQRQ